MNKVGFYLLDCSPDSFELLKYYVSRYEGLSDITVNLLSPLYAAGGRHAFSARFFDAVEVRECRSLSSLLLRAENTEGNPVLLYKAYIDHPLVKKYGISVDGISSDIETTEYALVPTIAFVNSKLADSELARILSLDKLEAGTEELAVTHSYSSGVPRFYLVLDSFVSGAHGDSGMSNQKVRTVIAMNKISRKLGYKLCVIHEDDIGNYQYGPDDIVHGVSVGSLYRGSYTAGALGFKIKNLVLLAKRTTFLRSPPIISSALHSSEFQLLPKLRTNRVKELSSMRFSSYTVGGLEAIKAAGLPITDSVTPIIATFNTSPTRPETSSAERKMLLQVDTQFRKNGEYTLMAIIDAFARAKKKRPNLKLEVICKSSAAYMYNNDYFLNRIIRSSGMNYPEPVPGLRLTFQGVVDRTTWETTMATTDIAVFMSVEEGIHLIVGEMWARGAHCVMTDNPSYATYKALGRGLTFIESLKVPYGGEGKHNDMFDTDAWFFNYDDAVDKLSDIILVRKGEAPRSLLNNLVFDQEGELTLSFLSMKDYGNVNKPEILFSRESITNGLKLL